MSGPETGLTYFQGKMVPRSELDAARAAAMEREISEIQQQYDQIPPENPVRGRLAERSLKIQAELMQLYDSIKKAPQEAPPYNQASPAERLPENSRQSIMDLPPDVLKYADALLGNGLPREENLTILRGKYPDLIPDMAWELLTPKTLEKSVEQVAETQSRIRSHEEEIREIINNTIRIQQTDLRNSEYFAGLFRDSAAYCHSLGSWFVWNGERWKRDENERAMELAKESIKKIYTIAQGYPEPDRTTLLKHAIESEAKGKLSAMLALAQPSLAIDWELMDANRNLLNVKNGTLDLSTLTFRPFRREDLLTKMAGVEYVPEATCPKWEAQIRWAFIGDENLIEGFQMLCGYALLGTNPEHKFVILWGGGRNGKTTIQNVLGGVLGEYAAQAAPETFMARKNNDGPRSDLARIVGARLVTTAEPEKGKRLAINFIKRLTGGDALQFREMYEKEKEVKDPGILVMMATNPKPVIPEQTDAAWRRPLLWPFNAKVLDDQVIVHLDKKLLQEGPGILNWLLEGLKKYYQNGYRLKIPEAVKLATDEYKEEMDLLAPWRHECTMNNPEVETSSSVLFESHRQWETQPENMDDLNHPKVMSRQRFGRLMSERYSSKKDTNGNMVYLGIGLKGQGRLT